MKYVQVLVCTSLSIIFQVAGEQGNRNEKLFSLFNVVKFRNTKCTSTLATNLEGVCYTSQECSDVGGNAEGNCAASFGVCCVVTQSTCGSTITQNSTYIENENFPSAVSGVTDCDYTVQRCSSEICQVRLDFLTPTALETPVAGTGVCANENLEITAGKNTRSLGINPPTLCGLLSGQHVYLDAGQDDTVATIMINIAAAPAVSAATWRIQTSQIECSASWRAPNGCLQYFTGVSGTVESFNFDGTCNRDGGAAVPDGVVVACDSVFLTEQLYQVCFRQELGMCALELTETPITTGDAFSLGDANTPANVAKSMCSFDKCIVDNAGVIRGAYIAFNQAVTGQGVAAAQASNCEDIFCGSNIGGLLDKMIFRASGTLRTEQTPFVMGVVSQGDQVMFGGFSLDYSQMPC